MPAGTIALTNNSTTVTGTGTNFTSELKANDFLVAIVGGVTYTLGVQSVNSATGLTLITAYNGPTATGVAWTAVPNAALVGITAQVAADVAKAIRGLNLDKANWQQVYSASGNITVTLPDSSQYTGPSWNNLSTSLASKANTSSLGNSASRDVGTAANTVAAGNDSRFGTVNAKTGGNITSTVKVTGNILANGNSGVHAAGNYTDTLTGSSMGWDTSNGITTFQNNKGGGLGGYIFRLINADNTAELYRFQMAYNGVGYAPGGWQTGSDERIKEDINDIDPEFALNAVLNIRHVTYKMRDTPDGNGGWIVGLRSAGYLAQDLEKYLPEAVTTANDTILSPYQCRGDKENILNIKAMKSIDPGKAAAALNGPAIKALYGIIEKQNVIITELQNRMKAIDGLDA